MPPLRLVCLWFVGIWLVYIDRIFLMLLQQDFFIFKQNKILFDFTDTDPWPKIR